MPLSIQASVLGGQGAGIAVDYRSQPVVAAWTFIPKVDWGMIVKIDQTEIEQPLRNLLNVLLLLTCIICIWVMLIEFFCNKPFINFFIKLSNIPPFRYIP